jgi:hypothetical protein
MLMSSQLKIIHLKIFKFYKFYVTRQQRKFVKFVFEACIYIYTFAFHSGFTVTGFTLVILHLEPKVHTESVA